MTIESKISSTVLPGKEEIKQFTLEDLSSIFNQLLVKLDPKLLRLYDYYLVKNNKTSINDIIDNLEHSYKDKNLSTDNLIIIAKIFDTIKTQLDVLKELKINKVDNTEILTILCSTVFSEFKKNKC